MHYLLLFRINYCLLVLVHSSERDASARSDKCGWLGEGTLAVWCGKRNSRLCNLGLHQDVEIGRIWESSGRHNWQIIWWSKQETGNFGHGFGCSRHWGVTRFSFWWFSHYGGLLQGVSWEWLCQETLVDYPIFDGRLLKRCPQKTASMVFGTLDHFSMTEFVVTRLKGAEHRDWMQSRQSLRMVPETGDLSLPGLPDVVSNIIGVWPLIVSLFKGNWEQRQRR